MSRVLLAIALGLLLEKGMSGGYFYGTPKPESYHPNM